MRLSAKAATLFCAAGLCAGLTAPTVAGSSEAARITPGTAAQIAALVSAAPSITSLPANPSPTLQAESSDSTGAEYPIVDHCSNRPTDRCTFGKTSATREIVVFGDSHAYMWLPAVAKAGKTLGYRVLLMWDPGCPAASVTPWFAVAFNHIPAGYDTACVTWRNQTIANLKKMRHVALVLLASRTAGVMSGPGAYFTDVQWQSALKTTALALQSRSTRVAVLGDILPLPGIPEDCLASHPTAVQSCAQVNPDPAAHWHGPAEQAEAKIIKIGFINTMPWVCTTTCSPVIGSFLPYLDQSHLDETYVNYLSTVMTTAVKGVL
jgi:hypothetical protein